MYAHRQAALEYARQHQSGYLNDLKEFIAIPSISTDPERKADMMCAAEWLKAKLKSLGMQKSEVMASDGHPLVYAEWSGGAPGKPVVLIYGHYDVQPVDPLELWQSGPFEAVVSGEKLFGRGASDMKGQVMAVLDAIEAIHETGDLPVNLKFMFEGEEEIGSPSLAKWMVAHKDLLQADFCLNPDAGMLGKDHPTITYGLRGLVYFELRVFGPAHDLHSGMAGGMVHNPAQALAELVAGMHDKNGHISLPGFYDSVRRLSEKEREDFARLPETEVDLLALTGVPKLWGEPEFSPAERTGARPTLEVNGLLSGFTGKGQKTVLPAWAMAKISCRLVPDQDPDEVYLQLKRFLEENAPATIRWELDKFSGAPASISDVNLPGVKALETALREVWGVAPFYRREGGSIPVVGDMQKLLGIDSALTGFGLPDDNLHAPNEKLDLPTWYRGIEAMIHFFFNL
ncbi:MAG TPA: dipeptidase [Anaerolineales bacterium]|jgi:acetylornithine deacetylase/succinyl-diaminopimelate desuccinylase-like protein